MMLKKLSFVTLGKDQFKVNVKVKDEKHICIIPDKHSYHDLSSIVMVLWDMPTTKVPVNKMMLTNKVKVKIEGEKPIYIIYNIPAKHS